MKEGRSESTRYSKNMARRRRKHDEEFKQQALAMARNG
jgi:transposase-like protein